MSHLPRAQRASVDAKVLLAEVVFEALAGRSSPQDAESIVKALDAGITPGTLRPRLSHEESLSQFAKQVDRLHEGLQRIDSDTLARRAKTGLDQTVASARETLDPPDAVRQLLAELSTDPELAGLAKLAENLLAAVSMPRSLITPEILPEGGVSDLSNRGSLDRLLISELAQDDLTLAVRVAVNEALYFRRETPPRQLPRGRAILVDAGIRMWGIPRIFALAVALALSATHDSRAPLLVFRAERTGLEPVDVTTRAGIESHLGQLQTTSHPGESLGAFFEAIAAVGAADTDAVLVTHADVLADPEFLAALAELPPSPLYVAAVDREGGFSLLAFSRAGRRPVREAKLSLNDILGPKPAKRAGVDLVNEAANVSLPAIFSRDPFPFCLPHVADLRTTVVSEKHGIISATNDGRLLQWRDARYGASQLTSLLPRGQIRVFMDDVADLAYVVITQSRERRAFLVTADLATSRCTNVDLTLPTMVPLGVFTRGGLLYFVYSGEVHAYALSDGAKAGSMSLDRATKWHRDRFFQRGQQTLAIAADGSTGLSLNLLPFIGTLGPLFFPFDHEGHDVPWFYNDSMILCDRLMSVFHFTENVSKVLGISRDGRRLVFQGEKRRILVDLELPATSRTADWNTEEELLGPTIYWSTRASVYRRNKFHGIGVDSNSRLTLYSKNNTASYFDWILGKELALVQLEKASEPTVNMQVFKETGRATGMRIKLNLATWNDGSKAWLDVRGILHLKSSDPMVPEFSITLTNLRRRPGPRREN